MLKNLEKNIPSFFRKFNFEFGRENFQKLKKFIQEERRFFYDFVNNKFLKVKIKEGKKVLKEIKTEVGIYRIFKEKLKKKRFFPKLISFGKYKNLDWILEEREKGIFGGEMEKDFRLRRDFLKRVLPEELAKTIFEYQKIKPKIHLYLHGGWWFKKDFEYHRKNFLEKFLRSPLNKNLISKKEIDLAENLIRKNKKFLDQSANSLCHGDLYPNNLIINEKGNLIILDWSLSTFNNCAFDVAFVYLMAHSLPSWQEKFLKGYLNLIKEKEKFLKLFRIDLISLANRFAAQCYYLKLKERSEKNLFLIFKNYLRFFKKAIS